MKPERGEPEDDGGTAAALRHRFYRHLFPSARTKPGLSVVNRIICGLIVYSVVIAILESEPAVLRQGRSFFLLSEYVLTFLFAAEYLARLWCAPEDPRFRQPVWGRLRYAVTPAALMDLLAISPLLFTLLGSEAFLFRLFRLFRILRLAKLGRYSEAIVEIFDAVRSRRYELLGSMACALFLLLISSTFLYLVESEVQPEAFGSIPRAMWWSVATLTTVGYGDVVPVTPLGRFFGGVTAIIGIGLIAMPTGILAAAFSDALARRREGRGGADQ